MRSIDPIREERLAALSQLGRLRPEWRVGQTMANLAMTAGRLDPGGVWDLEDEEALAAAKTLIEQYSEMAPLVTREQRAGRREDFDEYLTVVLDIAPSENDRID